MAAFIYEAKDQDGKIVKGKLTSSSKQLAINSLKSSRLYPMKVEELSQKQSDSIKTSGLFSKKVNKKHIAVFTRQFASMLKAGISLSLILDVLIHQERNSAFKEVLVEVEKDILSGSTLSAAMMKHEVFPAMLTSMVEVGEANGRLDISFERIALTMEKEIKLASKIKGAMIYPLVLLTVSLIASAILSFVVIPVFANMFEHMGVPLPPITITFIGISRLMKKYWYIFALIVILLVIFIADIMRGSALRAKIDYLLLKIPYIGDVMNVIMMARFSRTLSSLIDSGVNIVASLETVGNVMTNAHIRGYFNDIVRDVKSGNTIYNSVSKFKFFPPLITSMIRIGEESGRLGETLKKTAELYEDEAETRLQKLTALMEPAITILVAVMVGFIVLSVVQPMFKMYNYIGK